MKKKFCLFISICVAIFVSGIVMLFGNNSGDDKLDSIAVNDVVMTFSESGDISKTFSTADKYNFSVSLLDENKNLIGKKGSSADTISKAIENREAVLSVEGKGYIIISDDFGKANERFQKHIAITLIISAGAIMLMMWIFAWYTYYYVVKPFGKLRGFATKVAQGNLDCPLEMDKNNIFGAFTESFDIMR